jgi:hypothetical protein
MTTPTATVVTYSNAYNTVIRSTDQAADALQAPRLRARDLLRWALAKLVAAMHDARARAERDAALRRAGRDALEVERLARSIERDYPAMAAEMRAAAARHAGQFD